MKPFSPAIIAALTLGTLQLSAQTPRLEFELGYLRTWHADDEVTRRDWIQVPGTWRDPSTLAGQSQYAFTFRDTAWAYRFNHNHPMFTTRIRLGAKPDAKWQFFLVQSAMWNSWHQLSFMLGGELSYAPNPHWRFGLQAGGLSGYHLVHTLNRPALLAVDGPDGGVFAGANLSVDYRINPHWRLRATGNHLIAGLGLYYGWSPKPDPVPRR